MASSDEVIDLLSSSDYESDSEEQRQPPPQPQLQQNKQGRPLVESEDEEDGSQKPAPSRTIKDEARDNHSGGKVDSLSKLGCELFWMEFDILTLPRRKIQILQSRERKSIHRHLLKFPQWIK